MTDADPTPTPPTPPPAPDPGAHPAARLGAAWARSPARAWLGRTFTWHRVRNAAAVLLGLFLVVRVVVGLALDRALTQATEAVLGMKCKVGRVSLNLIDGQAILGDVALLGSSGTPVATLGRAELELAWTSLPNLIIERLAVEDVDLYLKRDAKGKIPAFANLLAGQKNAPAAESVETAKATDAPKSSSGLPVVLLKTMRVNHIRVHWEDEHVKPTFKGELVLDARGDEIATFPRPTPPTFSLRLASPGVLDSFRFDVAGRALEDGASAFDILIGAEAHPAAIAPYLGSDVQVCARTISLAIEARANARPTLLHGGKFYTGVLTIERAEVAADDDELDLGRIVVDFTHLARNEIDLASLTIDHPRLDFGRLPDGALRVLGFGLHGKSPSAADEPAAPAAESGPLPPIKLGELALHDGKIHFKDESTKPAVSVDLEYRGGVSDVVIDPSRPGHRAKLDASLAIPGVIERIGLKGSFVPVGTNRDLTLELSADGVGLAAIAPYLKQAGLESDLKAGSASAELHATALSNKDGSLGFSAELTKAKFADRDDLMALRALRVEGGQLAKDGAVVVDRIAIEDPSINLRRHKSGALSVGGVRTMRLDPNEPPPPEPIDEEPAPEAPGKPPARIRINELALTGGKIGWRDDALNEPIRVALDAGTISLTNLALGEKHATPAALVASAKLRPQIGELKIEASVLPDPGAPAISGTLTARDLTPKALSGYLKHYAIETTLERGRIEAGLYARARFKGPALAESRVLLAPLTLKSGVNELGSIDSIELKNTSIDPATHTTNLGDLTITGIRARAFRDSQGAIRTLGLKLNPVPPGETADVSSSAPSAVASAPPRRKAGILKMGRIAIEDAGFWWHDSMTTPASDVRLERLDVSLGPRRLDQDPRPDEPPTPLKLHAQMDRLATLDVDAGVVLAARAPVVRGDIKVSNLTLSSVAPYLAQSGWQPVLDKGSFEARLDAAFNVEPTIMGAVIDITKLRLQDGGKELLGLDRAHVPFELDSERRTFHMGEIALSGARFAAQKTADGELATCGLLSLKAAPAPVTTAAPSAKRSPSQEAPLTTNIDGIHVDGLALDWRDAEAGGALLHLTNGSIDVAQLRPGRKIKTSWKVAADLANLGKLSMDGIALLTTRTEIEANLDIEGMNGRDISPYLGEGTRLDLANGSLALKLAYSAEPAAAGGQKLGVAVDNFALSEKGTTLLGWDTLRADLARSDGAKQVFIVDRLELSALRGLIVKLPGGKSRSFGFDKTPVVAAPRPRKAEPPRTGDPPALPTVELRRLSLGASEITIRDRSVANAGEPPPFRFQDLSIHNTAPFQLQGEDPTTAVLDLAASMRSGGSFELASATLHAVPFDAEPTLRLELDLKGVHGAEIARKSPGLSEKYDLASMQSGVAHLEAELNVKSHERLDTLGAPGAPPLAFELTLENLEVKSAPEGPVLLGIDELHMDVPTYDLATGAMTVRKVEVANPVGIFANEPGGFRAIDILTKPSKPGSEPAPPPEPAARPALQRFERITVTDGDISWIDSTMAPLFDFPMRAFEVDIRGYSNHWRTARSPMSISVRSRAGCYDDLKFKAPSLSFSPKMYGDFEARILGLPLERLNAYTKDSSKFIFTAGKLDVETRGSFFNGHCKAVCRLTLMGTDVEELEGSYPVKTPLAILADADDEVALEVPLEFDLDQNMKFVPGSLVFPFGKVLGDAAAAVPKKLLGDVANIFTGKKKVVKTDEASRKKPPVPFGPVEVKIPDGSKAELDELAEKLKAEPLFYVSLRGEVGKDDEKRALLLASPAPQDRRDLIARLEAERARLERRRADAIAEVRGALQAGTDDLGVGRSHLTEVTATLQKLDKSLESLYEQEREGAERAAGKRAREIESELCDNRVEAIAAYLASKGAPAERVKRRPPRLKGVEQDKGCVTIESWTARRKSIERSAVKQEVAPKEGASK